MWIRFKNLGYRFSWYSYFYKNCIADCVASSNLKGFDYNSIYWKPKHDSAIHKLYFICG